MNYGFTPSKIDGTEYILSEDNFAESLKIPAEYSYEKFMPKIIDQGNEPICCPCAVSTNLYWKNSLNNIDEDISLDYLFEQRGDKNAEGMQIKELLHFLKHDGYISSKEYKELDNNTISKNGTKITSYAILPSPLIMQRSLFVNGPFIIALYVMDSTRPDFWNGSNFEGGHAVSVVGYNEQGLRIRNSWGYSYGESGYYTLDWSDFGKIKEAWAII